MRTYVRLGLLLVAVVLALAVLAGRGTPAYAWSYPAALNTDATADSREDRYPQVATDGGGNWVAVWNSSAWSGLDRDILVARSTDSGATWTDPAALNTNAGTDSGHDDYPQVATDGGGNWVTVWNSYEDLFDPNLEDYIGTDDDILVSRSTDNGASWTAPAALNTNAATDSRGDSRQQVTADGGGNWVAIWNSSENLFDPNLEAFIDTDYDILVARSSDNGQSWSEPAALNTNAATDSEADIEPDVTSDGAGHWVAVWGSWEDLGGTGTDAEVLVARSTDNGGTWTAPAALNSNAATDSDLDYNPEVTTDGGGNWAAVWQSADSLGGTIGTDHDILYATEGAAPPAPVGGIAELPDVSDSAGCSYVALAGLAAAALGALGAGGWYARRRFSRG